MALSDLGLSNAGLKPGPALALVDCFFAIAFYNVVELNAIIYTSFRRRGGLYFWSFVVATWGIAIYSVGFLTKDLGVVRNGFVYCTLVVVGWMCMVTGQSMVLFSRMHLLVRDKVILRTTLGLIATNAVIGHFPTAVVFYGSNSPHPHRWLAPYAVMERIHVTIFFLQELAISAVYIVATARLLRGRPGLPPPLSLSSTAPVRAPGHARRFLAHLIAVNVVVVVLDITILALEFAGLYAIQTAYKGMVYSIKLKLEFSILNSLVEMTRQYRNAREGALTGRRTGCCTISNADSLARASGGTSGYAQLIQTVDSDGRIQYSESRMAGRPGSSPHVMGGSIDKPDAVHHRGSPEGAEIRGKFDDSMVVTSQFVIPRHRREEWEDKSDLDELVLCNDVLR